MKHYFTYQSQFIEMFGDPVKNDKNLGQKNLSALGKLERGVSKFRPRNAPELLDGPYPLVQTGDVANCDIYITNYNSTYSEIGLRQSKLWPSGTLCITIAANIAKTGILTFDACFPDSIVGFIPDKDVDILYIHFWFNMIQQHIENLAPSTAQKNINLSVLSNLQVICPPISDQKKFSNILEQADKSKFSSLKSQFIEMFGDPMTNTKEWSEYGKINQYAQVILGTTPNSKEASYWDGDIKWITPAEMTDESYYIYDTERHITEDGVKSASLTLLPYRSVLFSTRAPIGKVGLAGSPMYCNQGFKNFICGEKLNPVYLYYSLIYKRDYLISLGTGTTFKELSKKTVEGLNIAVPPIHLQNQFESIYDQADKSKLIQNNTLLNNKHKFYYCHSPRHISS